MQNVMIDAGAPALRHTDRRIQDKDNIISYNIVTVGIPHMEMYRVVYSDIAAHRAEAALTQLDSAGQAEIVFDDVVGGAVVKVDIPAVITAETACADDIRLDAVQLCITVYIFIPESFGVPEPIPSP